MSDGFRRQWMRPLGALALTAGVAIGGVGVGLAQEGTPAARDIDLTGAPVALHDGSCTDPIVEPEFEIGQLAREEYGEAVDDLADEDLVEAAGDFDGDGVLDEDEEGFITEDIDGDGELDEGEDLDDDGVLDAGIDEDGDGALDDDEVFPEADAAVVAVDFPRVWKAEEEIDATFEEIFANDEEIDEGEDDDALDDPGVIAIHESSANYGTIVACADLYLPNWEDRDEFVVGLNPVQGSGFYGYAVFERDTGNIPVFGENTTGVTVYLFENLSTLRTDRMAEGTPTP